MPDASLRIIPLGGLGEVGKNMTVYEYGDDIVVVDAGLAFPRDEQLGVDLVLPDFGYLSDNAERVRAVLLTHGHEDHVGGLPYLLRRVPIGHIWGTKLTLALVQSKLDEHGLLRAAELHEADPEGDPVDDRRVPRRVGAHGPLDPGHGGDRARDAGRRVVHTGDYKIDHTPVDGMRTDVGRLADIGNRGVDLLVGDSTNAERPGVTPSERVVGEAFRQLIPVRTGRIFVSSFASNVHRMQQAIDVAAEVDRKVAVIGRSMRKTLNISRNLGYIDIPDAMLLKPHELEEYPRGKTLVLCSGSQGEPLSALTRIAYNDHPATSVERGDTVIISAKPIPGNELRVHDTINGLAKLGAEVLHEDNAVVHASGHANAEELRLVLSLLRPRCVMPVHGEYRMQAAHARLAEDAGVDRRNIVIAENGSVVELTDDGIAIVDQVQSGVTFVDGLGVGDVRDVAIRDRQRLSEDGVVIVVATLVATNGASSPPELIVRGVGDAQPIIDELRNEADQTLRDCLAQNITEIKLLQEHLHDNVGQVIYDRTGRRPMILPVIVEV